MADNSVNQAPSEFSHPQSVSSSPSVLMFGQFPTSLDMPSTKYLLPAASSSELKVPPKSSGEEIPEEIWQEILCRLPAKQVANFRLVCKRWRALTSAPHFVELHLNHWCNYNLTEVLIEKVQELRFGTDPSEFSTDSTDIGLSSMRSFDFELRSCKHKARKEVPAKRVRVASASHSRIEKQNYSVRIERALHSFDLEAWRKLVSGGTRRSAASASPIGKYLGDCLSQESDYNAETLGNKSTRMFVSFSALGFVVFHDVKLSQASPSSSCCVILNPVTREKVKLIVADEDVDLAGQVYGIFLHPVLQKICVLWGQRERLSNATLEFKLLNLGSSQSKLNSSATKIESSCWRNIISRLHRYRPRRHSRGVVPPVIVKDVLYWMADCGRNWGVKKNDELSCEDTILAFDIEKENFEMLPHPGPCCPDGDDSDEAWRNHKRMHLLETNNGVLSLCEFSTSDESINIWVRRFPKKGGTGMWIRNHSVKNNSFPPSLRNDYYFIRAFGMVDEELVLVEREKEGLYVLNLKLRTVELLETRDGTQPDRCFDAFMCSHSPSFATMTRGGPGEVLVQVPTSVRRLKYREDLIY